MTFEDAAEAVAADFGLEFDTIKKIYARRRKEERAARAWEKLEQEGKRPSKSNP
jgi:hypothetical protein